METFSIIQETGTLLAWIAFLLGGGIAYGKLSTSVDEIKGDVAELKRDFTKFTEDYGNFKIDTGGRLGAIRRSQNENPN
jgi:hypothetical protein